MEDSCSTEEDDNFFNALEDFPFYDCLDCTAQSEPESHYSPSHFAPALSSSSDSKPIGFGPKSPSNTASSPGLRRRRSFAKHSGREMSSDTPEDPMPGSSVVSEVTGGGDGSINGVDYLHLKKNRENDSVQLESDGTGSGLSGIVDSVNKEKFGDLMISSSNGDGVGDSGGAESSTARESDDEDQPGFLFFLVELVFKAIGLQLSLIIGFVTFPFWVLYTTYMFMLNPFLYIRGGRDYLLGKIIKMCNLLLEAVAPSISEWFKENHSFLKGAVRCAWGLFCAAYVGSILVGLLVSAFAGSGLIMRCLVEEPFQQKHLLNFDFTENKPVAIVPITASRSSVDYGENILMENHGVLSPNRKLQATIRLTLPESEYNRKLGMFQVRIEFMGANGKTLASLRQPCMLHFRSEPIRLLQIFLKIVPIVAGYSLESQTLKLKFRGFTEGEVPCAYLKVIMEQRAEFRPAGGIPEVYDAALLLESELPLLKSILWSWRKTLFVWVSMVLFMIELLFALVCCRTVVMPTLRLQSNNNNNAAGNSSATPTDEPNAR